MTSIAPDYQTSVRMALKMAAVPLPDVKGSRVLDIGCDMGAWSFHCADEGARSVLGLDRNRAVKGFGPADLIALNNEHAAAHGYGACRFTKIDLGKQWHEFGRFDLVLCLSIYHHWYENCGDHRPIWFWLWRHCAPEGVVLWEGPVDDTDPVVRANVSDTNRRGYNSNAILAAARVYFVPELIGPALHEPTRQVWRLRPRKCGTLTVAAAMQNGAGGATAAFKHAGGRRIAEIAAVLGITPLPGSLNLKVGTFDWESDFYRARVSDVADRSAGLDGEWAPRWARFYPVTFDASPAFAFRFEGERYPPDFVELIASFRLREALQWGMLTRC